MPLFVSSSNIRSIRSYCRPFGHSQASCSDSTLDRERLYSDDTQLNGRRFGGSRNGAVGPGGLRHTFATHAARFGTNPWRLQAWLGHSPITMTKPYVHHAEEPHHPIPHRIPPAGNAVTHPYEPVLARLGAPSVI